MRLGQHNWLVTLPFADCLVRTHFVEPLALDAPTPLVEFENGRCMPRDVGEIVGIGIEVNANQREQSAGLPITSPENVVVPVGRVPSFANAPIGLAENRDEPRFKPLAMLVKEKPRVIDMHIFDNLAERPMQYQPGRDEANRQDAGRDEKSHD